MTDTPEWFDIRDRYAAEWGICPVFGNPVIDGEDPELKEEFDRWLRETWYEGFCKGEKSGLSEHPLDPEHWNPHGKRLA